MSKFVNILFVVLCTTSFVVAPCLAQKQQQEQSSGFQASPVAVSNYYDTEDGKYFRVHIVEKGHTLYSIARAYKCAVSDIIKASSDNTISIGEAVRIPMFTQKDLSSLVRYNIKDTIAKNLQLTQKTNETQQTEDKIQTTYQQNSNINTPIAKIQASQANQASKASKASRTNQTDTSIKYLPPKPKDVINISIMLPLYTSEVNFPKKQYYFLSMLEGVLAAVQENEAIKESSDKSPKINLNVFDLTEDEASWKNVENDNRFLTSDIILCAAFKNIFPHLDNFSKINRIPLIHLHSERDSMSSGNPYFMQLLPSLSSQIEILADTFITYYNNSNFLIFLEDTKTAERLQAAQYLFNLLEKAKNEGIFTPKNLHLYNPNESEGYGKEVSLLEQKNHNVICGFTHQEIFLANMFVPLLKNNPDKESGMLINNYQISLFGPAAWANFTTIDPELFYKTSFTFFNTFATQTDPAQSKAFEKKFYDEYGTLPDGMAYKGYMFAKWLFEALHLYNTDFMSHINEQNDYSVLGLKFNFQKSHSTSGYENRSIELLKFFE
ncbi:MAG: LysM peptidoglycan-binding domain-containing protein [Bacteroidales bacterium]|jgi:LysM repeat protein|nr:LysM peptidoglycan-binding domain-containing protein [Bacteroidales bacterium]